jgi:ATP-dependent DNA helicase PIF1
MRAHSDPWFLD